jgi:hypothetical protein
MFELFDAKDKILDLMAEALGSEQDIITKILNDFRACKPIGDHIVKNYEKASSLKGGLSNLFEQCLIRPGGLVILRHVTARYICQPAYRVDFKRFIAEYASLDDRVTSDDKKELLEFIDVSDASHPVDLVYLDHYSTEELAYAKKILLKLAQPGEVYHVQSSGWPDLFSIMNDSDFKLFLKATLSSGSPEAAEVFRHQINSAVVSSRPYLLVLVEQTGFFDKPYQFRHEIIYEACSEPVKLHEQRLNQGAYQTGTMDDFTRIASPWINAARQLYPNLLLEIFLPDELLLIGTSIEVEVISGGRTTKVPLWSCGVPAVLRPLCRAEKAGKKITSENKKYVDPLLSEKWETLRCGNGMLHTVCHQQLVDLKYLRPRLSHQNLVGAIMLIDLPLDMGDREVVFGEVIDNGLAFFAWWKPNPEKSALTAVGSAILATTRLKYMADLFGLHGFPEVSATDLEDPNCDLDDLQAPAHLHAMETVAEELRRRASRPKHTWVHDLLILVDHPERWPKLILYEQELGGALQSPI